MLFPGTVLTLSLLKNRGEGEARVERDPAWLPCSAGLGQIDHRHLDKLPPELGMLVVKIGGPAYRIGMGGGAASSVPSGSREGAQAAELDFNAVQAREQHENPANDVCD